MRFYLLIKFFFISNNSSIRISLILPLLSIIIGSFIITMTFAIMDGMENEIISKIKSFSFGYKINTNLESISEFKNSDNYGITKLALVENNNFSKIVKIKLFSNLNNYKNNINNYRLIPSDLSLNNEIFIGKDLANYLDVNVGDEIIISAITDINFVTGYINKKKYIISEIFEFEFMNYDSDYVVISYDSGTELFDLNNEIEIYFNSIEDIKQNILISSQKNDSFSSFRIENEELIYAMNLEKVFYIILGYLTIFISAIMIYNNTILNYIEKKKQFAILRIIGMKKNKILFVHLMNNIILGSICTTIGIITTNIIIFLNYKYYIMNFIFLNMPFKILPMDLTINVMIQTLFFILLIISIATFLPFLIYNKNDLYVEIRDNI